jgi:hypothetical protein
MEVNSNYYKAIWEGFDEEDGFYYSEVIAGKIQRQIIEINSELYWATLQEEKHEQYIFTDQPEVTEEDIQYSKEHLDLSEITKEEFVKLWLKAKRVKGVPKKC